MSDFRDLVDLASERLGGTVIEANDEFFAPKENLVRAEAPMWREGEYTERGKWMDGWETRRRRTPGNDWCLIRLGLPGNIRGVVVDTSYFRGNFPERCSIEACVMPAAVSAERLDGADWTEILPESSLRGDALNAFPVRAVGRFTHLRFNIFPDGGVARLRVHGEVIPDWEALARRGGEVDLAGVENGGFVVACSDMFFGHRQNLIMPGRALNMGDGWETKRRRGPGHDWAIVRLGLPAPIRRVEVDTDHFRGNAPDACAVLGCDAPGATAAQLAEESQTWITLVPQARLQPHARHSFDVAAGARVSHVRLNIFPDGGIARLRLFGTVTAPTL